LWVIKSFAGRIVFNPEDYATAVRELFTVAWECPSIEPPSYLLALDPGLYCRELKRAGERLTDAPVGRLRPSATHRLKTCLSSSAVSVE
jgi:hypothetical protein